VVTENLKSYFAGLFDGEGFITIEKRRGKQYEHRADNTLYARASMEIVNKEPLELAREIWGGVLYEHKRKEKNRKTLYTWILSCRVADRFLRDIYPYMQIKDKQAELIFKLHDRIDALRKEGIRRLNEKEVAERKKLYLEIRRLKKI